MKTFFPDQIFKSSDYAEAEAATSAKDLPSAGKDPEARSDEHQRGHVGPAAQAEPELPKVHLRHGTPLRRTDFLVR